MDGKQSFTDFVSAASDSELSKLIIELDKNAESHRVALRDLEIKAGIARSERNRRQYGIERQIPLNLPSHDED